MNIEKKISMVMGKKLIQYLQSRLYQKSFFIIPETYSEKGCSKKLEKFYFYLDNGNYDRFYYCD